MEIFRNIIWLQKHGGERYLIKGVTGIGKCSLEGWYENSVLQDICDCRRPCFIN
jgi:hypothetical protein